MSASPKCSPATVYIGLGSNRPSKDGLEPARILDRALDLLAGTPGLILKKASARYRTRPQGDPDQPWFINQVVEMESRLEADALLDVLMDIETRLGRVRDPDRPGGPRTLDLDMLIYGQTVLDTPRLTLPHPRLGERAFVLVPLTDMAPDLALPDGRRLRDILDSLSYKAQDGLIVQ